MATPSWEHLLWAYVSNTLTDDENRALQAILQDNPARRAEIAEWHRLRAIVREDVSARVRELPQLPPTFFDKLDAVGTLPGDPFQAIQTQEMPRGRRQLPPLRQPPRTPRRPVTLVAAVAAMLIFAALVIVLNQGRQEAPDFAQSIPGTPTPKVPSATPDTIGPLIVAFDADPFACGDETCVQVNWQTRDVQSVRIESGTVRAGVFEAGTWFVQTGLPPQGTTSFEPAIDNDAVRLCVEQPEPLTGPVCSVATPLIDAVDTPNAQAQPQIITFTGQAYDCGGGSICADFEWQTRGAESVRVRSGYSITGVFYVGGTYDRSGLPANGTVSFVLDERNMVAELCAVSADQSKTPVCEVVLPDGAIGNVGSGTTLTPIPSITPSATNTPDSPGGIVYPTTPTYTPQSPPDPALSITPSLNEPIVPAPARISSEARLPNDDVGQKALWSNDNRLIVQGMDGVWIYDGANVNLQPRLLPAPQNGFVDTVVSPDNRYIATQDWDRLLTLWDAASGEVLGTHNDPQLWDDMQFTADSRQVISRLEVGMVSLGVDNPGNLTSSSLPFLQYDHYHFASPDGQTLVEVGAINGAVRMLDFATGETRLSFTTEPSLARAVAFNHDGSVLAIGQDDGRLRLFDTTTGDLLNVMPHNGRVSSVIFNDDSSLMAYVVDTRPSFAVWVWNRETDEVYVTMTYDLDIGPVAFNPTGDQLAVVTPDSKVFIIDLTGLQPQ